MLNSFPHWLHAFIWFLPSVNPHMKCRIGFYWKNYATLITSMSILPTQAHHIASKLTNFERMAYLIHYKHVISLHCGTIYGDFVQPFL